jgi:hypothetical protein
MMKKLAMTIGLLLLLARAVGAEEASQNDCFWSNLPMPRPVSGSYQAQLGTDFVLVASIPREEETLRESQIADELLSIEIRERSYSDPDVFAGLQLPLPNFTPLNIVLATDDLLNPTCGLTLHLFW